MLECLPPWEILLKKMIWAQLGNIRQLRILDFGSGLGITANHYAESNEVIAVEPSSIILRDRFVENHYCQIRGDIDAIKKLDGNSFDMILCHNVLEYVPDRTAILRESNRLLKPSGTLSVVKLNRSDKAMQIKVLRNEFETSIALLEASDRYAELYGTMQYYPEDDLINWCDCWKSIKVFGIHTFLSPQQMQELSADPNLQEAIFELEMRASEVDVHRNTALFHHVIIRKDC